MFTRNLNNFGPDRCSFIHFLSWNYLIASPIHCQYKGSLGQWASGHLSSHSWLHFGPVISVLWALWFTPILWLYKQAINVSASLSPAREPHPERKSWKSCLSPHHPSHPLHPVLRWGPSRTLHISSTHYCGCDILKANNSIGSLPPNHLTSKWPHLNGCAKVCFSQFCSSLATIFD